MVYYEYRASILRRNFWLVYSDGYGRPISDRYLPVFLYVVHLPRALGFGELSLLRKESGSHCGNVDIEIGSRRRRGILGNL